MTITATATTANTSRSLFNPNYSLLRYDLSRPPLLYFALVQDNKLVHLYFNLQPQLPRNAPRPSLNHASAIAARNHHDEASSITRRTDALL